jgi:hypothetical protein
MYQNISKFIEKELKDLDHRVITNGKLNMQEAQYVDLLAHLEKSLLTCEAMKEGSYHAGYSDGYKDGYNESGYNRSYEASGYGARGRRRDSMGRYADEPRYNDGYQHDSMIEELHSLMEKAPNEQVKRKYSDFLSEIKGMM